MSIYFLYHRQTVLRFTPRFALRILVPASCLTFLLGLVISGAIFFRGKPFDLKAAVISDLESPEDNPSGYAPSAAATAVSAILLAPAAAVFYRQLRNRRIWLSRVGAALFALGIGGAVAIGILAPFTRGYSPLHIQLAYAAFIGIGGGIWFDLLAVRTARVLAWFQGAVFLFLIYRYFGPDFFSNDHLLTSIAFLELLLCTDVAFALWALARSVASLDNA
ncbi:MAG TPA: hypothetical protein VMD99_09705 [Terriglobales bacterium]|nr:hypothetical protein [Terriglobales bacterium]